MRYLLIIAVILASCNPKTKKPSPPVVVQHLGDSVLENKQMDEYSVAENMRRRKPPRPKPGEPPPPPVTANGCLLLDFNGQVVSNTMWNTQGDIILAPSGLNVNDEQTVFDKVVSYYAVFNPYILITRDETVFNSYPQNKRRRVILTTSWEWFGQSGGVAYINSFSWFDDSPCFVFTSLLGFNAKNISDASAHEGGHTLGNRHQSEWKDGVKISEYLWGDLIMGASYNSLSPRWGIGLNSLGEIQNDTLVILETLRK